VGCESAAAGMGETSLGMHLQVANVERRVREGISDPTGTSSCARSEGSTAARRAALERWAREGSREVDEGRESIREWAALGWRRERLLVRGREGKDIETFLSASGLVLFVPPWEPPSHNELMVLMILNR
jgi:hypothetical protein